MIELFTIYVNGTTAATAITANYLVSAGGAAVYEDGQGWSTTTVQASATLLNDLHSGYSDYQAISNPAVPGANTLRIWGRSVSGRMLPKWMGPSGVDTPFQPALFGNNIMLYAPNTGTTAGLNIGAPWAVGTTVAHPQPTAGAYTQIKRTTSTNVVTTTNQVLGVSSIVSTAAGVWVGNAAGLGGFFFLSFWY